MAWLLFQNIITFYHDIKNKYKTCCNYYPKHGKNIQEKEEINFKMIRRLMDYF